MNWNSHKAVFEANEKLWDRRTAVHLKSEFYDNESFLVHKNSLMPMDQEGLGDLKGRKVLHLQCHFGQDTISMEQLGASTVGIDLSTKAIDAAKDLALKCKSKASFHCANVYDIDKLNLGKFDTVYTSYGTICWLPDLDLWAKLISQHLTKGGQFYMVDFHPVLHMIEWEDEEWKFPYFSHKDPFEDLEESSYTENKEKISMPSYFWQHPISEILQALINNGLNIKKFQEYDWSPYNCFPKMKKLGEKKYQYLHTKHPVPHLFEIQCVTN